MSVSVREAMEIGALMKCKVVAGEGGLDRKIDHVMVMEIPDVAEWLNGNDLLLTSLFPIKDDEKSISQLIAKLDASGSAAIAIKNRYFDEFPEVIISEANRLNFPVIEIKHEIAYLDIISPIMKELLHDGYSNRENIEEFFKWITELALGGKGLPTLVQAVESFLGNPLSIESDMPFVNGVKKEKIEGLSLGQIKELINSKRPVRMIRKLNGQTAPSIVAPILLNDKPYGYISCWEMNRKFSLVDITVVERLVSLFALEFLKIKTRLDVEQEYKNDFLYEILLGRISNEKMLMERAALFNMDLTLDYQIIVLEIDHFGSVIERLKFDEVTLKEFKNKIINKIKMIIVKGSIITTTNDNIVILFPYEKKKEHFQSFLKLLQKVVKNEIDEVTFTIGVGGFYTNIIGIHQGYEEALKAIKIGRTVWGGEQTISFEDLGIYRLLTQVRDKEELKLYFNETIGLLADYDKKNNAELVDSLSEYFKQNYSLVETAKNLFIHVNTLKYRLEKIESLTSLSVHSAEDRLRLQIGLKISTIL